MAGVASKAVSRGVGAGNALVYMYVYYRRRVTRERVGALSTQRALTFRVRVTREG